MTPYAIGDLPSLSFFAIVLNQPIARQGGGVKASLVIGSGKSGSETGRKAMLLSSPCCGANSNHRQSGLGVPSLITWLTVVLFFFFFLSWGRVSYILKA